MPNIDVSFSDLKKLVGPKLPSSVEKLEPYIWMLKSEIENFEGDALTIKVGDTNRPDLWCVEGLARELRGALDVEKGIKEYKVRASDYRIFVNQKLEKIRPYIACVVVKNIKLTDELIKQIMQQQDKIDGTYGRKRAKTSIGLYNLDLLAWPLKYGITKPDENAFVPLTFTEKLLPKQILEKHPKGLEYQHLLKGLSYYPIFTDAKNNVLSMPPVINSNDLGQVNEKTTNVLVEVTGTDYESVNNVLRIMAITFADRGGDLYSVIIDYPSRKPDATPHFETRHYEIKVDDVSKLLGEKLSAEDVVKALQKARYNVSAEKNLIHVTIPSYRTDIMHQVDIYEDVAIFHGLDKFTPESAALPSVGKLSENEKLSRKIRELCIGTGAQEIMSFVLTNNEYLFGNMNMLAEGASEQRLAGPSQTSFGLGVIEIDNPVSFTYSVVRSWLLPSLLEFLSKNTAKEFPQKIFEVGDCVILNAKAEVGSDTVRKLAFAFSDTNANFTDAKQALEAVAGALGWKIIFVEHEHPSFISGRSAAVMKDGKQIGFIGEIHPQVIKNWNLGMPVVGFEVSLNT
ncbi:MAG: phenylalanine--tRNA ligase subunit beta [DPANN group archaeon]|nr:phenylalanine--tRNA ligase subunit beta [DPANN group archaeon]